MPGGNVDPRPLPAGWTAHFDHQRNMWYYVNLNTMPPQLHLVHPDDQGRKLNVMPLRQRRGTAPSGSVASAHHDTTITHNSHPTPFAAAMEAQKAKEPTFAQILYASSLSAPFPPSDEPGNSEEDMKGLYGFSNLDVPWRTPSPQEALETISTQIVSSSPPTASMSIPSISFSPPKLSASPSSSPPRFSSPMPEWNPPTVTPPPSRRPRGARTPTFSRRSFSAFSPPVEEDNPRDGGSVVILPLGIHHEFHDTSLIEINNSEISSVAPLPPPPLTLSPPPNHAPAATVPVPRPSFSPMPQKRTRHNRSATFPNITHMNPMVGCSQSSSQISRPKETPMYTLVARPPEEVHITGGSVAVISPSPRYNLNNLPSPSPIPIKPKPILSPLIIPNSSRTRSPMNAAIPAPNLNPFPHDIANAHQKVVPNHPNPTQGNHEVLKQAGMAVGKSVGQSTLRLGAKVLLGKIGIPSTSFSSNNDAGDVISSGLTNMVTSAATAAIKTSVQPPSTNLAPDYAAVLAQMQGMHRQPPVQQIMPQQTGFDPSNAQVAAIMAQMQMLQLQQQQLQFRPPAQIPLGNNALTPQNISQTLSQPQPQLPQWQKPLVSNLIGGATHSLVSGAMSDFNIPGTMDSDAGANSFTDFASFDANP